jgi:DtxR family Mn-dependent transcriptional regulator
MPKFVLSPVEAAYLKELYRLREMKQEPLVSVIAGTFHVSMPSVIDVLQKLEKQGLVKRTPWRAPRLTRSGLALARQIIHSHRIIEVYYGDVFGLEDEYACAEASKIDYLVGATTVQKMCAALDRPAHCLHGFAIEHGSSDRRRSPTGSEG